MLQILTRKKTQAAQVYFPIDLYLRMKRVAKSEKKPLATWIRQIMQKELKKKEPKKKSWADMPTFSWPDVDSFTSQKIDDIVYGSPHGFDASI